MKLENVLTIKLGLNLSRQKDKEDIPIYSNKDMLEDLEQLDVNPPDKASVPFDDGTHTVRTGDIVYNFINTICGIVSPKHDGKTINQNFAKIIIDDEKIDAKFLCYLLNESSEIERQKFISFQGTIIKKLSPSMIQMFDVTLPPLETQKKIGQLYFNSLKRQALNKKEQELENTIIKSVLDNMMKVKG